MLRLALAAKPPTGFMHDIVVEDTGEQKGTFDIKHGGLLPVVDLARYAALRADVRVTPTVERLRLAAAEGVLGAHRGSDPRGGLSSSSPHSGSSIRSSSSSRAGNPTTTSIPKQLDPLTRRYLRDAFREVAAVQRSLTGDLSPR